jgi:glycosyltransferase involved in cell wall biosynthesis
MKKVIILSGVDPCLGSGRVLIDIQKSLNISGFQTHIISNLVGNKEDGDVTYLTSYIQSIFNSFKNRILSFIDIKKDPKYSMYDLDLSERKLSYKKTVSKFPFNPDFIIYFFEHQFLTEKDLYHIGKATCAPIFFYMADFGPLTGGCHYSWDCKGYENQCGNCPGIYSNKANDLTHQNFMLKKKYIEKTNITPVVASSWQFKKLLESNLYADKPKYNILLPINENLFIPIDKLSARKSLGLPIGKNIIYSGSTYVLEERKGYKQFVKGLNYLYENNSKEFNDNIHVLYSGNTGEDFISGIPYSNTILPYVDYNELYMIYNAIDIFASTSLQDAGPTMINQSMMCGTPVVSFKMGVALDLIDEGVTGYLADMLDFKSLANGIKSYFMLNEKEKKIMSKNCRNIALSSSSLSSFSSSFLKLFNNAS